MANKKIDLNNEDFGFFLQWYKEVYAEHCDFDTTDAIIDIVISPHKYEKYYTHIDSSCFNTNYTMSSSDLAYNINSNKNIENIPNEKVNDYQWKKLEEIDKALEDFTWYDKKIFELYYYEGNTLDSLAAKTSISRNSLFTTIDKVREMLKKKLNE